MPIAEAQSEWIADVLEGRVELPDPETMKRVIVREDRRMRRRYVASKRHTIQVDFYPYLRTIKRERRRRRRGRLSGALAGRSHELRLPTPAR
jgi:dimethylaniline monooxygenase (N-oxide forming)